MTTLERELRGIGPHLDFPAEGDFATLVVERLRREPAGALRWWSRRPRLALALALAVAALGAAFAVPQTRGAILDFFQIGGVRVERVQNLPPAQPGVVAPGERMTLADADDAVEFDVLVPEGIDVRSVRLDRALPGGRVSLVLANGVVLQEFEGRGIPLVKKLAGSGTQVEFTRVNDAPGAWIFGAPHVLYIEDRNHVFREERRVGNVLLWERGGVTFRLEGARTLRQALDIAERVN